MEIAAVVFKQYLASRGIGRGPWSFVRKVLIKLSNDPTCSLPIHGMLLKPPLSPKNRCRQLPCPSSLSQIVALLSDTHTLPKPYRVVQDLMLMEIARSDVSEQGLTRKVHPVGIPA
jgi:hypothetical protein